MTQVSNLLIVKSKVLFNCRTYWLKLVLGYFIQPLKWLWFSLSVQELCGNSTIKPVFIAFSHVTRRNPWRAKQRSKMTARNETSADVKKKNSFISPVSGREGEIPKQARGVGHLWPIYSTGFGIWAVTHRQVLADNKQIANYWKKVFKLPRQMKTIFIWKSFLVFFKCPKINVQCMPSILAS